jgi:three-Cys-motif partner protein
VGGIEGEVGEREMTDPTAQRFGGPWSLIKTQMVSQYMKFFNTALKKFPFKRIYIDAFAGSGEFTYDDESTWPANSLFQMEKREQIIHAGSAKLALQVIPSFDEIIFIEQDRSNASALELLIEESNHPHAHVERGDANQVLKIICEPAKWRNRRGVIFLDPFGMDVEWKTLETIAATKSLDLWLLFPLAGVFRNLPRSADRLDDDKRTAVSRVLGTEDWFNEFYAEPAGFFPMAKERRANVDAIENYVSTRLRKILPHVERPKRLLGRHNAPLFSLFFAVSNPNAAAIKLASKAAAHILRKA